MSYKSTITVYVDGVIMYGRYVWLDQINLDV
jgi:hypothetical protein